MKIKFKNFCKYTMVNFCEKYFIDKHKIKNFNLYNKFSYYILFTWWKAYKLRNCLT